MACNVDAATCVARKLRTFSVAKLEPLETARALDFMKGPRLVKGKALAAVRPASGCAQALANAVKHQIDYDCVVFLWRSPESLPGAGTLIQHAARLASGAIPDEMQRALFSSAPD
jgi:hypothetical protein